MGQPTSAPAKYRFGAFELDRETVELRKRGVRIKLQEQPYRVLCLLLYSPGEVVTRETLCADLWPENTFVEFERSLNAAIAKLRQTLGDAAENPRFIETVARRGYRFIAPVEAVALSERAAAVVLQSPPVPERGPVTVDSAPASQPSATSPDRKRWILAGAVVTVLIAAGVTTMWLRHSPVRTPEMTRLTFDSGLTMDPAVSPDGKLLAYVSDRSDGHNLNIWIQQLTPAGTAVQLTHFDSDASGPSFSPDGAKIVFRSTDKGGGIYTVPTIGGEPTRLAPGGRNPRFSPDGQWIAYWIGVQNKTVLTGGELGEIYILPASGGLPHRLGADLRYGGNPIWSPDSKRLLVFCPDASGESVAWCMVSINGKPSSRTSIFNSLKQQGFSIGIDRIPRASQWTPGSLLFSAAYGDAFNAWRIPISEDGRSVGFAERLTSGTTLEASPVLTPTGNLIFASLDLVRSIWGLPLDTKRAKVTGELKEITGGPAETQPSISLDGQKLAFVVNQYARPYFAVTTSEERSTFQARVKDISTGKEAPLSEVEPLPLHPQISHDGTLLAYTTGARIKVFRVGDWPPRIIFGMENGGKIWDWSADNKRLLVGEYPKPNIYMDDVSSGRESVFLSKSGYELYQAKFSPDNRAVVLVACDSQIPGTGCRLLVTPLKIDGTPEKDTWAGIEHPSRWDDKPRWSPDGNLIYFVSDRDGQFCLWAQRMESRIKQPIGTPFPLYHFHNSRLAMNNVGTSSLEIDVARNNIVMGLGELKGNLWSLKR